MTPAPTVDGQSLEFVRWNSGDVQLLLAPGSDVVTATTNDEPIAAVLERRVVDGMEWIKVEVGRGYAQDFVATGWAPHSADVKEGSKTVHVDPVYEPTVPDCPSGKPTLADLDGMLPLESLFCFGSGTLTFSPVVLRLEGDEEEISTYGTPHWLTEGGDTVGYWMPDWTERGSIRLYVDPNTGTELGDGVWVEISGHLDDPASTTCTRTSEIPEFRLPDPVDAVPLCRGRFVVSEVRRLSTAEIPPRPNTQTPGPGVRTTAEVTVRDFAPPLANREGSAAVWTGSEMVVWGGSDLADWSSPQPLSDGAAYSPSTGDWRSIPDGPLAPRSYPLSAWTGSEMLVWGGMHGKHDVLGDGAKFDPSTNSWHAIAKAPVRWAPYKGSVWTGTEWWVATQNRDHVEVAAYDPSTDSWTSLPSVSEPDYGHPSLAWTGSEILMRSPTGVYRMGTGASDWTHENLDLGSAFVWADGVLFGLRNVNAATDPLGWDPFSYPVAWDPSSGSMVDIPSPPSSIYGPIWTGTYLVAFASDLAYDPAAQTWFNVQLSEDVGTALEKDGSAQVWADDRLIVFGGTDGCGPLSDNDPTGYELIPQWPTIATYSLVTARSTATHNAGSGGGSIVQAC